MALTIFLLLVIVALVALVAFLAFYIIRFSRIIFSIEETLSEALETLLATEASVIALSEKQLFFDSREIQIMVKESMDELKQARVAIARTIDNFTQLSKQKYVTTVQNEPNNGDNDNSSSNS